MVGCIGLNGSLQLLRDFGLTASESPIADRVLEISGLLHTELEQVGAKIHSPREDESRTGIVTFEIPGCDAADLRMKLMDAGVVTSARNGRVRAAAHCYNNADDIKRLTQVVQEVRS